MHTAGGLKGQDLSGHRGGSSQMLNAYLTQQFPTPGITPWHTLGGPWKEGCSRCHAARLVKAKMPEVSARGWGAANSLCCCR